MFEYRKDGWPLCPVCGDDELMSTMQPAGVDPSIGVKWTRQPTVIDPMRCLSCGWEGRVPSRESTTVT